MSEQTLLEVFGVRFKKQEGVLILTSTTIAWTDEYSGEFKVKYHYQQIKAQRISAEASSKVQLQLILFDNSSTNFHFTGDEAVEQRNKVKQLLQYLLPKFSEHSNSDLKLKSSLLSSDASLHQLYKDLVAGGLISPEEFWANRLSKNDVDTGNQQQSGLPSAFLADVQAVADGCNAVKYNLTVDTIDAIFRTYPSVKSKHAELVPSKMSESEFWVQFFQSQLFHRDTSSTSSDIFSDCLSKERQAMIASSTDVPQDFKFNLPDPPIEGYSTKPQCPPVVTKPADSMLLQRCNQHSYMVLKAIRGQSRTSEVPVPCTGTTEATNELTLKQSQKFLEVGASADGFCALSAELSHWTPKHVVDPNNAYSAVTYLIPGGSLMPWDTPTSFSSTNVHLQLLRHQAAIAELLRHFWACFPVVSTQLEDKVGRMYKCLQDYEQTKLAEFAAALDTGEQGLISHMKKSIAIAGDKYLTWRNRKDKS